MLMSVQNMPPLSYPFQYSTWFWRHMRRRGFTICKENGYAIDYFAFYKYSLAWIVPTLAFTVSLGMLVSVVFNSGIPAIPLQFAAWLMSLMPLSGDYRLSKYIIRFNRVASSDVYARFSPDIAKNRFFFTLVSAVLFALAVYIWSKRRNGAVVFDKNIIGARKA